MAVSGHRNTILAPRFPVERKKSGWREKEKANVTQFGSQEHHLGAQNICASVCEQKWEICLWASEGVKMRVVSGPRPGLKHTIVHKSHGRLVSKGPNMEAGMDISAVIIHTPCNHSSSTPPITRPTLLTCIPPYLLHADLCAGQHPAQHVRAFHTSLCTCLLPQLKSKHWSPLTHSILLTFIHPYLLIAALPSQRRTNQTLISPNTFHTSHAHPSVPAYCRTTQTLISPHTFHTSHVYSSFPFNAVLTKHWSPLTRSILLTLIHPYLLHAVLGARQHPAQHVGDVFMRHARPVVLQIETEKPVWVRSLSAQGL